jgi:hypothetical protein
LESHQLEAPISGEDRGLGSQGNEVWGTGDPTDLSEKGLQSFIGLISSLVGQFEIFHYKNLVLPRWSIDLRFVAPDSSITDRIIYRYRQFDYPWRNIQVMSDLKVQEEVHGISSALEDPARVVAGYGQTTKREGAKTKEVANVSFIYVFRYLLYSILIGKK